jgi:hypothetical protein
MPHPGGAWEMHMRKGNGKDNGAASGAPWNDRVAHLMSREGLPREKARDQVILDSLKRGDTNPLAALLIDGHVPAPSLRFVLALMLLGNEEAEAAIARQDVDPGQLWLPYRFVMKARPAQPRRPHGAEKAAGVRGAKSGPLMPDLGYEAAIACLDQAVLATDAAGGKTAGGKTTGGKAAGKPTAPQRHSGPKRKR